MVNLSELAPKVYNSYFVFGITVTHSVAPFPSNHFAPFTAIVIPPEDWRRPVGCPG